MLYVTNTENYTELLVGNKCFGNINCRPVNVCKDDNF